jgi:hypothetical protein
MPAHLLDKREGVKRLLRDGNWHSQEELVAAGGLRFGGRIHELRHDERLSIECRFIDGAHRYRWPLEGRQLSIAGTVRPVQERSDPMWTVGEEGGGEL